MAVGFLAPDLLAELRADPYLDGSRGRDWKAPNGATIKKERSRQKVEKPAEGSAETPELQKLEVNAQIAGRRGPLLRKDCQNLNCGQPSPAFALEAFLGAFKACNEEARTLLDTMFHKGPMSKLSEEDLGENGQKF